MPSRTSQPSGGPCIIALLILYGPNENALRSQSEPNWRRDRPLRVPDHYWEGERTVRGERPPWPSGRDRPGAPAHDSALDLSTAASHWAVARVMSVTVESVLQFLFIGRDRPRR